MTPAIALLVAFAFLGQTEEALELAPLEPQVELAPMVAPSPPSQPPALANPVRTQLRPRLIANFAPGTELRVTASSLGLRRSPAPNGPLIYYIKKHERITALQDAIDPTVEIIGGRKGQWLYVQHNKLTGYVFDAYVELAPPPLDDVLDWLCVPGTRVGPIDRSTSYDDLASLFGEENLADIAIDLGEGESEPGTVLFPDSEKELIVQWEVHQKTPMAVIVVGPKWHTPKGLAVGTRVSSLVALNNGHFNFSGFGWDFGGMVTSWEGGALESEYTLREMLSITLAPRRPYVSSDLESLQGNQDFSSKEAVVGRVNLRVSSITVMINPPINL